MLLIPSLQTFVPVSSFYSIHLWLCKGAAELADNIEELIGIFSGFRNLTKLSEK